MATASVSYTPECSICCESLKSPKFITCGHTFCLCCIERYIGDRKDTFPCPLCKQNVKIPEGGAKMFTTNFIVKNNQSPPTKQPKCPNHKQKEVDYYCNNCNVGLCFKCIYVFNEHEDHETLDIECDETRITAIEKLQRSQKIILNRIKNLEKTRSRLFESFEQLESLCEDACTEVTEKTEDIVSDLRKSCKKIIKDIRKNLEENRNKVEDREMEIGCEINLLENNMESNISPSTETTLNILFTLPRLKDKLELGGSIKDYDLCLQYLQWVGKDFSLDIDQIGSVISKSYHMSGSYQFQFDVSDIENSCNAYYNTDKFRYNNLVWSCGVEKSGDDPLYIDIKLLPDDNPKLDYCIIDGQISLLNNDDDSKTLTRTVSDMKLKSGVLWSWWNPITWYKFTNEKNGYLNSKGQFVVKWDITQIKEISFE